MRSLFALAVLAIASSAAAQPKKPPPYSLPWQLRPVLAATAVRSDTALAFYEAPGGDSGTTIASMLLASYKLSDELAPLVRLGVVQDSPPAGSSGFVLTNPALGATYAMKPSDDLRLGLFLGVTVPVGMGGGNSPDLEQAVAESAGVLARSAMDNAMFAVNDLTVFPGAGLAWLGGGFTVQVEATLLQLTRVRGSDVQKDSSKTNLTSGLHVGWFAASALSLGAEIRHQRWLSTPAAVEADGNKRDNTTVAFGPRLHLDLGEKRWFRPGLAYAMPLDKPMSGAEYKIVQLDLPLVL